MSDHRDTLARLLELRDWLDYGTAYMEHPEGQEGTDRAVQAIDVAADALRAALSAHQGPSPERRGEPPTDHPEATCRECGRANVVWFAPSDVWNATMGGGGGILCPVCFVQKAEHAGLRGPWIVAPSYSVQQRSGGARSVQSVPSGGEEESVESSRFLAPVVASPQTASAVDSAKSATDSPHHHPASGRHAEHDLDALHRALIAENNDLRERLRYVLTAGCLSDRIREHLDEAEAAAEAAGDGQWMLDPQERSLVANMIGAALYEDIAKHGLRSAVDALRSPVDGARSVQSVPSGPSPEASESLVAAARALCDSIGRYANADTDPEIISMAAVLDDALVRAAGSPLPPEPREEVQG